MNFDSERIVIDAHFCFSSAYNTKFSSQSKQIFLIGHLSAKTQIYFDPEWISINAKKWFLTARFPRRSLKFVFLVGNFYFWLETSKFWLETSKFWLETTSWTFTLLHHLATRWCWHFSDLCSIFVNSQILYRILCIHAFMLEFCEIAYFREFTHFNEFAHFKKIF